MHKDLTGALKLAEKIGVSLPTVSAAREMPRAVQSQGNDQIDSSAVVAVLEAMANTSVGRRTRAADLERSQSVSRNRGCAPGAPRDPSGGVEDVEESSAAQGVDSARSVVARHAGGKRGFICQADFPGQRRQGDRPGDAKAQTRVVIEKMRLILAEAGMTLDDVMSTTVYLQDLADYAAMNSAYIEFFKKDFPARATVRADLAGEDSWWRSPALP